jgi:DNA-binding response OmpR family regulator
MKILLVEDEPDIAVPVALALENLGHHVTVAMNIRTAVEHIDTQSTELVITDLRLPDGNGFQIARTVHERRPSTPVIIATGYDAEGLEEASRAAGASALLRKPFTVPALMSAIDAALNGQALQR